MVVALDGLELLGQERAYALGEVGELLGEEQVALLEGRELLEGERVDGAEAGEVPLRAAQAGLLLGAHVGRARGLLLLADRRRRLVPLAVVADRR